MNYNDIFLYTSNLNLLYVEDDENLLIETVDILKDYFKEVHTAKDGLEGFNKYLEYKETNNVYYDLIITDINMPKMNGIEMINKIKDINNQQTIVVTSAYNEPAKLIEFIQLGISNFILKPLQPNNFMRVLYNVSESITNKKEKEQFLIQQSKLASIGEIVDSIAHQWKNALYVMKLQEDGLHLHSELGTIDNKIIEDYLTDHSAQIDHLINTLDQFRNFFKEDEGFQRVNLKELINETIFLIKDNFISKSVKIEFLNIQDKIYLNLIKNEFIHVIINILNNAIEQYDKDAENKIIKIYTEILENDKIALHIEDNAGGIPSNIINHIFKRRYTTKKDGTGIGLYLVDQILEKVCANIEVKNKNEGACFSITFKSKLRAKER